ncbi:MAG: aminotransferase class I/II-fold pyridoxal phosphate-dependent enzyme [Aquabacterium sp.]|jgi:histidinol-phosphate aminotransferase|uniref:aminotransferase class I/II-fold pyridoxal phosphate-dependent enzyme n=1 Tax=Aquabacterium sp. TaxID=1872578 RepID=UPI002A36DDF8|nr:aminotransferase class I/II-fold pyridoxal phosphate-dependent enzyme [Aquabacterium sp.]MDX9844046.1 aminotransferase class I/II-fold pyridoxal phosphate-dependent enzyme [Aquabacterium sp.]
MNEAVMHGGPDSGPVVQWDFSSNANVRLQPAALMQALVETDRCAYPDPSYTSLRATLAAASGCTPEQIVPTSGSSEGIRRLTLAAMLHGVREVWVPHPGYGDYAAAANALGLTLRPWTDAAQALAEVAERARSTPVLWWLCEPCNPTGASLPTAFWEALQAVQAQGLQLIVALDRAYEPLRLIGADPVPDEVASACWQLWSPNKSCGLTGVRAGWMQAPEASHTLCGPTAAQLDRLAPSWVLSAEGVSLLSQWHLPVLQTWLAESRQQLAQWQAVQAQALSELGWTHRPGGVTPFMLSRPPLGSSSQLPELLAALRVRGIKLRDASSFGLPGWVRWRAHEPAAGRALCLALRDLEVAA